MRNIGEVARASGLSVADGTLTLVATDRYRMAVASAAVDVEAPPARVVLPLGFVDAVRPRLTGTVVLDLTRPEAYVR